MMRWRRGRGHRVPVVRPGVTTLGAVVVEVVQVGRRAGLAAGGTQPPQSLVPDGVAVAGVGVVVRLVGITVGRRGRTSRVLL